MEQSTLFTTSKWDLLQVLSTGEASPIELAAKAHTSLANISQQLRLLELAGFVRSHRIPNRDKGKPRIVYSLTDEFAFIVVAAANFVEKKFIKLSAAQKATLRCWFCPDGTIIPYLERALETIITYRPSLLAIDLTSSQFYVVQEANASKEGKDAKISVSPLGLPARSLSVKFVKEETLNKLPVQSLYYIIGPGKSSKIASHTASNIEATV